MPRFLTDRPVPQSPSPIIEFYREEFRRHHRCLRAQREYFSEQAIADVESALLRIIAEMDRLSSKADADKLLAGLLKEFDVVTRLSVWSSSPRKVH
ncbi:MAG: hypothetical protein AB7O67_11945 [Vicinamibacterales bacterium]